MSNDLFKYRFSSGITIILISMQEQEDSIIKKAIKSGTAGASAMVIQVSSLMWMRTTMNYQFKNGGSFIPTIKHLYAEGGIPRFYRGMLPALIIGPISRFGDTAMNMFAKNLFKSDASFKDVPIFIQTSLGSFLAGMWRISTLPIDAWKTSKQVYGADGLKMLFNKYHANGIKTFYQGGVASASATMAGHYPWFLTNNYLDYYIPKYSFKDEKFKALVRSAVIGFCCTLVSDTISNSIRVMKTMKQTSETQITYQQAFNEVIAKDGYQGLFLRGLKTKLMTNGIQGVIFSIFWRYFEYRLSLKKDQKA